MRKDLIRPLRGHLPRARGRQETLSVRRALLLLQAQVVGDKAMNSELVGFP